MRVISIFLFLLAISITCAGQLTGLVLDESGAPSAFTSIYVQNTSTGTLTNEEGLFDLQLEPGAYSIVFDHIGYKKQIIQVELGEEARYLEITMIEQAIELVEVEVLSEGEDPAYPIIRKAIEKRPYYLSVIETYQCDVYIKGMLKLLEAPEKILGQEVGDMDGVIDSSGQGILYLSESESILYFQQPDQYKEEMTSSKVSGEDNGFSFNSARDMDFSLYRNFSTFPRQVISPIAANAFSYYTYRLESSVYDDEGRLINKIAILPKREEDPVYRGYIYVVEDLWNLASVDVYVTGKAMNEPIFDTLHITQQYVPVSKPDKWALFSQSFQFSAGIMGFKFGGQFVGVYSNYQLSLDFDKKFFGAEIFKVEDGANNLDSNYFEVVRPIPLTREEQLDYQKKDSIQLVRNSEPYLDSIDQVNNKFKVIHLLAGYTYQNSKKHQRWEVKSPLDGIQFNSIQGLNGKVGLGFRNSRDKDRNREYEISSTTYYGHADKQWLNDFRFRYRLDRVRFRELNLAGGTKVSQYNEAEPISPANNEFYSLYFRRNYLKIYRKGYVSASWRQEIANGLMAWLGAEWAQRNPLTNHTEYSFINWKARPYTSNNPQNPDDDSPAFSTSNSLRLHLTLRFRPGQKYLTYPERKFIIGSDWPDFKLNYMKGIPLEGISEVDYDRLSFEILWEDRNIGLLGTFSTFFEAGMFLNSNNLEFMDWKHFHGNQTVFGNPTKYLQQFLLLPYYTNSTTAPYMHGHIQHHFNGFLMDRVPLLKKTSWHFVLGASALQIFTFENDPDKIYSEISFGIDDLGWGAFRFFRLDGIVSFSGNQFQNWGVVLGLKLPPLGN